MPRFCSKHDTPERRRRNDIVNAMRDRTRTINISDVADERYCGFRDLMRGIVSPALIRSDAQLWDNDAFTWFCMERNVRSIQRSAEKAIASGRAGALQAACCLASYLEDFVEASHPPEAIDEVKSNMFSRHMIEDMPKKEIPRALSRLLDLRQRASLYLFQRTYRVLSALLVIKNPELNVFGVRRRLLFDAIRQVFRDKNLDAALDEIEGAIERIASASELIED